MAWFESTRESDLRKSRARTLYDFEVECRWQGWGDPACVFDEEKDLFRLTDGRYASCLECPCACIGGWVFVGYIDEHGEERQTSYRCRRAHPSTDYC
jgi:hypothetical protein